MSAQKPASLTASLKRDTFRAREACSLTLSLVSEEPLGPGDQVEFQFPNAWSLISGPSHTRAFQLSDPADEHFVHVSSGEARFRTTMHERHLNYHEGPARHGRHFVAVLSEGLVPAGREILVKYANTYAPYVAQREPVWVRVKGATPDPCPMLVTTPLEARTLRVIAPSDARPGEPFDVLIVSLDRFENASCTPFEDETLRTHKGEAVATGLTFVGAARVRVARREAEMTRFAFRDAVSNAVRVARGGEALYWGDIHIHTRLSHDAQGGNPYPYARDVSGLDFAGNADHWESLGPEGYHITESWAEEACEPGRFVSLPADERNPEKLTGHHNLYFRTLSAFRRHRAIDKAAGKQDPEAEASYLSRLDPCEVMVVPHHTGIRWARWKGDSAGRAVNWDAWDDPGLRPVMEIYSHHGQSELYNPQHTLAYEFNRMRNPERRSNTSVPGPYYAQDYWMAGHRIGVIASSDEHSGQGGRRHGGIAAVSMPTLSRDNLFDALRRRHCYATTGERILVEFTVDGVRMGDSAARAPQTDLHVQLKVWGTSRLLRVDILRFRFGRDSTFLPLLSDAPRPESTDASYDIRDLFTEPCMYYARVVQEPLEWPGMAWTSPVWIDRAPAGDVPT